MVCADKEGDLHNSSRTSEFSMTVAAPAKRESPIDLGTGIKWEESTCPLCENSSWRPVLEAADNDRPERDLRFAIVECSHCSLRFTNPRPTSDSIGQFYAADYEQYRQPPMRVTGLTWRKRIARRLLGRARPEKREL